MSKTKRSRGEKKTSIPVVTSIFDKLQASCFAIHVNLNLQRNTWFKYIKRAMSYPLLIDTILNYPIVSDPVMGRTVYVPTERMMTAYEKKMLAKFTAPYTKQLLNFLEGENSSLCNISYTIFYSDSDKPSATFYYGVIPHLLAEQWIAVEAKHVPESVGYT